MKKNGNPQKGIFILFLSFAIFINSCSDTILKIFPCFSTQKGTPFKMLHRSPIGHAPGEREILLAFSAKPPRKIMQSIVFYISAPPDMIDKII